MICATIEESSVFDTYDSLAHSLMSVDLYVIIEIISFMSKLTHWISSDLMKTSDPDDIDGLITKNLSNMFTTLIWMLFNNCFHLTTS